MEVLVYKTNINDPHDVERIKPFFKEQSEILKWNVDIEDDDRVLRVEAHSDMSGKIETLVCQAGYWCKELT